MVRAIKLKVKGNDERFQVERALKPYGYNLSKAFLKFVENHIREHHTDLIQVDFYPYLHIVNYLPQGIRRIFVQHEIRYIRNQRLLVPLNLTADEQAYYERIKQMEIDDINRFDRVITLTQTDRDIMQADGVTAPISVSPAAVNSPVMPFEGWNGKLSFIGGYSHIPNQEGVEWFVKEVLPLVDTDRIKTVDIVGGGWPQHYNGLHPKVHFLGFVDDLAQAVHGALLIVPILTGSGMRMKILDAAAMGVPFVTTAVGVEGLDFHHNESCLVADTPEAFAAAVNSLTNDEQLQQQLASQAQQVFMKRYSVEALAKVRNNIYERL